METRQQQWARHIGQRKTYVGTIGRFGHKHRQGADIKRGATLVVNDVHLKGSSLTVDHAWLDYTVNLAILGELVFPGNEITFTAVAQEYTKGGSKHGGQTFTDIELTDIKDVTIKTTRAGSSRKKPKNYELLVDNALISYVIRQRLNTKTGKLLGEDPQGWLGKIYVGNGFANKLGKYLTWKWCQ